MGMEWNCTGNNNGSRISVYFYPFLLQWIFFFSLFESVFSWMYSVVFLDKYKLGLA